MPKPLRVDQVAAVLAKAQNTKEWHQFFWGMCGPAAQAMNEVLMGNKGTYAVLVERDEDNEFPKRWVGHVALLYRTRIFDYMGELTLVKFARWGRKRPRSTLLFDVPFATVEHHFIRTVSVSNATKLARSVMLKLREEVCNAG